MDDRKNPREGYCKREVYPNERWGAFHPYQCSRKIWKDGYCKIHHPDTEAEREKKRTEKWERERENSLPVKYNKLIKEKEELIKWLEKKIRVCENKIDKGEPFYDLESKKEAFEEVLKKIGG